MISGTPLMKHPSVSDDKQGFDWCCLQSIAWAVDGFFDLSTAWMNLAELELQVNQTTED